MTSSKIIFSKMEKQWEYATSIALNSVMVFSPYISSPTAEKVLSIKINGICEVYILFNAEVFINGASSISALRKILKNGYKLYHLKNLHSKLIIVDNDFASLGSQNLTYGGTKNKESNVVFHNPAEISKIVSEIEKWIDERVLITSEMLDEMEGLIAPYVKIYQNIIEKTSEPEKKIFVNETKRIREKAIHDLRKQVNDSIMSNHIIPSKVRSDKKWSPTQGGFYTTYSLKPISNSDFTQWLVAGKAVNLLKSYRYMCLDLMTGKLGWARVFRTRITFFSRAVDTATAITIANTKCDIGFEALWDIDLYNIQIKISPKHSNHTLVFDGWFNLLYINKLCFNKEKSNNSKNESHIYSWICNNISEFLNTISAQLLSPFKFKRNLSGVKAKEFFNDYKGVIRIRLAEIDGHNLLVAES